MIVLVSSNSVSSKIIMTIVLMTIPATIAYSGAVVVVWLSLLCCCGLGCNDSSSGNNINVTTTRLLGTLLQGFYSLKWVPCSSSSSIPAIYDCLSDIFQNELNLIPYFQS